MNPKYLVLPAILLASIFTFAQNDEFGKYALFEKTAKRAEAAEPVVTNLPLKLDKGVRIGLVGNTLFDRMHQFGHLEALVQQAHPGKELVVRNLSWAADEVDLQPRPANFANAEQHLTAMEADVVLAAFGYNESFAGKEGLPAFRDRLTTYLEGIKAKAYNGNPEASTWAATARIMLNMDEFITRE